MAKRDVLLIAEDNEDDFFLFERAARKTRMSAEIRRVSNGREAIDYLDGEGSFADRTRHPLPRMLVLDLKMPRLDGFAVLSWLAKQKNLCCLPVLVLSSSNQRCDVEKAYHLGANSYAVKPNSFDTFVEQLDAFQDWWLNHNEICHLD